MPCYEVRTINLDLKIMNHDVLNQAIKTLGWQIIQKSAPNQALRFYYDRGEATYHDGRISVEEGHEYVASKIKQAYAREAVWAASKKFGWSVSQNKKEMNKLTLNRRG